MSEQSGRNIDGMEIELARRIDSICRRLETDWREGQRRPIDDYLAEMRSKAMPRFERSWRL